MMVYERISIFIQEIDNIYSMNCFLFSLRFKEIFTKILSQIDFMKDSEVRLNRTFGAFLLLSQLRES